MSPAELARDLHARTIAAREERRAQVGVPCREIVELLNYVWSLEKHLAIAGEKLITADEQLAKTVAALRHARLAAAGRIPNRLFPL